MKVDHCRLSGVKILTPTVFEDERGFFLESFNQKIFDQAIGHEVIFVQDNHSRSRAGVLRGLHFQSAPHEQSKLIRITQGAVYTVVVDMRPNSATFLQWLGIELSSEKQQQLWVPEGFAHGFYTLSETADCQYKTTDYYSPEHEESLLWNDSDLAIAWPFNGSDRPIVSSKDVNAMKLTDYFRKQAMTRPSFRGLL